MNRLQKHKETLKSWMDKDFKPIESTPDDLLGSDEFDFAYSKYGQKWFWIIYEDSENIVNDFIKVMG